MFNNFVERLVACYTDEGIILYQKIKSFVFKTHLKFFSGADNLYCSRLHCRSVSSCIQKNYSDRSKNSIHLPVL